MGLGKKKKTQKVDLEELGVGKKTMDLLGGSDSEGEEEKLVLNKDYVKDYEKEKQRKEFDSLRARVEYDEDSSEGTEEDEDGTLLDDSRELKIFEALAALRSGDKETAAKNISAVNSDVKEHLNSILKGKRDFKDKKLTIKDYMREKLLEKGAEGVAHIESDEEAEYDKKYENPNKTEVEELKRAFIEAAEGEEDGFLVKKNNNEPAQVDSKTKAEVEAEAQSWWESQQQQERDVNERLARLFENVDPSDKKESFLKNFFLNHGWQGDGQDITENEIDNIVAEGDREDDFEEDQLKFEEAYEKNKYRHEAEESAVVQSHPRSHLIDDSLRKETNTRKAARERKKTREEEAKVKRDEEVKRLKHLKRQEMNEKLEELKKMAGTQAEELFTLAELEEDFDPDAWDKKMSSLFNDKYYNDEDESFDPEEEKPSFSDMSDFGSEGEGDSDEDSDESDKNQPKKQKTFDPYGDDEDSDDDVSELSSESIESEQAKKPEKKKNDGKKVEKPLPKKNEKISSEKKKEMEKRKAILLKQKEAAIGKAMSDYTKLDYEDVVGGEKVRFKYRNVPKEQFALTDDDILTLDDRTLNQIAPLKFYAPYKSKADNARDAYVASQTKRRIQHLIDNPPEELQPSNKYRTGMAPVYVEYNEKAADEDLEKIKKDVSEVVCKKDKKQSKKKEDEAVPKEDEKKKKKKKKKTEEVALPKEEKKADEMKGGKQKKDKKRKAEASAEPVKEEPKKKKKKKSKNQSEN